MAPHTSSIWKHFTKLSPTTARCHICLRELKSSGNTTNVKNHFDRFHKAHKDKEDSDGDDSLLEFEAAPSPFCSDSSKPVKTWSESGDNIEYKMYERPRCPKFQRTIVKPNSKSHLWKFFGLPADENGKILSKDFAVCMCCKKPIASKGGCTSNMKSHLRFHHPQQYSSLFSSDLNETNGVSQMEIEIEENSDDSQVALLNSPHEENANNSSDASLVSYLANLTEDSVIYNSPQPSLEISTPSTSLTEAVTFKKPSNVPVIKIEPSDEPPQKKIHSEENNSGNSHHLDGEVRTVSLVRQQHHNNGGDFRGIFNPHQQNFDTGEDFKTISIVSQEGDELEAFGRSIVLQMRKLTEEYNIELMAEIQNLVTQKRREYIEFKRSHEKIRNRTHPSGTSACVLFPNYSPNANVEVIIPNDLPKNAK